MHYTVLVGYLRWVALGIWLLAACTSSGPATAPAPPPTQLVHQHVAHNLDTLLWHVEHELLPLAQRTPMPTDSLRQRFRACRLLYKRVEPFTEYFMPGTARLLNGPPIGEIEVAENKEFDPAGLQVIEECLYPEVDPSQQPELVREVKKLRQELRRAQTVWQVLEFTDAHVFDVLRQQVFRVVALGITGFDTPLTPDAALPEAATAVAALRPLLAAYAPTDTSAAAARTRYAVAQQALIQAERYLRQGVGFAEFDRMAFITGYANPLGRALLACQRGLDIAPFQEVRALRPDAATLFDSAAFNPDFYAPTAAQYRTAARVALGRRLFHDPVLSRSNTRSCASCHQPDKAFTDGLAKNVTLTETGLVHRNTPTILNAALQAGQFYDLRATTLENQAVDVVGNRDEMHGSLESAAHDLQRQPAYVRLFLGAFPEEPAGRINPVQIQTALASYERSLVALNSRFDQYMRGRRTALNAQEIQGFNLFMGKAKCGTCHFAPLFNGTVPPGFTKTESEVLGVPATPAAQRLDPDLGRYAHTQLEQLRHAFKTPTVRNVAHTAPYMHNGAYRTLEQVLTFYNEGGGRGLGLTVENQTLSDEKLHLTTAEQQAIQAFLLALTDMPPR
ncbi:cytochrome C peroxidase [Hymenobacter sp. BT507]|uniref:Cytochrome C peroxidase n=1 Tax=Hymenobacter citatus TaxID=2763506 RepID=A0ABR7MGC2_9BACT|nr:cytochrome c peroxidase [Hymenobacter citatus]MBC6610101.1 cytochrome C peroxidase [Hymenobacter citatus]